MNGYYNASSRSSSMTRSNRVATSLPETPLARALDAATREQVRQAADAISVDPKRLRRIAEGFPSDLGCWAKRELARVLQLPLAELFPRDHYSSDDDR